MRRPVWVIAVAALVACTRDYDDLFSESSRPGTTVPDGSADVDASGSDSGGDASPDAASVCTSCTGGDCTIVCASACPCSPSACAGPECNFECVSGQTCLVENTSSASTATTTVTCRAGSTCDVTCEEPPCSVVCEGDAKCRMTCLNSGSGDDCVLSCLGGTLDTSCDNSGGAVRRSCNTSCPPPN